MGLPVIATLDRSEIDGLRAAMSDDPARMNLNGILLDEGGAVATDGHRMLVLTSAKVKGHAIVHRKFWEIVNLFGDTVEVRLLKPEGQIASVCAVFECGAYSVQVWCRCIDEEFPNYKAVIPRAFKCRTALTRASIEAIAKQPKDKNGPQVVFESGKASKSTHEFSWSLPLPEFNLTEIERVAYNPRFLRETPAEVDTWEFGINGTDSPSLLTAGKWTAVVMPMDLP
jgi:DNA polymerase III sliding clamp (beta) subunit (PCNA family)